MKKKTITTIEWLLGLGILVATYLKVVPAIPLLTQYRALNSAYKLSNEALLQISANTKLDYYARMYGGGDIDCLALLEAFPATIREVKLLGVTTGEELILAKGDSIKGIELQAEALRGQYNAISVIFEPTDMNKFFETLVSSGLAPDAITVYANGSVYLRVVAV